MNAKAVLLFAICISGCNLGRPLEVVIPDGFVGEARVVYDPQQGAPLASSGVTFVFRISASGELRIKDQSPFYRWHYLFVHHENGNSAKVIQHFTKAGVVTLANGDLHASTDLPGTAHVWVIGASQ